MSDLKVDLVHHLVVGLELVELHLEVGRRQDVGEDHGVQVHGLLVAPEGEHVALLARQGGLEAYASSSSTLLLLQLLLLQLLLLQLLLLQLLLLQLLLLRVACQRGAVVSHVGMQGEEGGLAPCSTRSRALTPWIRVGSRPKSLRKVQGAELRRSDDAKCRPRRASARQIGEKTRSLSLPPTASRNDKMAAQPRRM